MVAPCIGKGPTQRLERVAARLKYRPSRSPRERACVQALEHKVDEVLLVRLGRHVLCRMLPLNVHLKKAVHATQQGLYLVAVLLAHSQAEVRQVAQGDLHIRDHRRDGVARAHHLKQVGAIGIS